ncbi:Rare lipoprotein A [Pseudomonas syringae pv. helianthi]|uniref:Endolytic peptidoglycan transglycosylase RlpA n=1 Tax=Pseudomonas syringae pv. helianthi TaxID=251654 RepID=A0A3M6CI52_9PSED|nr:Rare lipoprotein A [Pseudomonas syringae pv. helianthi]
MCPRALRGDAFPHALHPVSSTLCDTGLLRHEMHANASIGTRVDYHSPGIQETAPMRRLIFACSLLTLLAGCANHIIDPHGYDETGTAAYYGAQHHGNRTASGEAFNQNALTAAHRQLPFGTRVKVTNLDNDRSVVVRINDRGPHTRGRLIDVSREAAEQLGMLRSGTAPVRVQALD